MNPSNQNPPTPLYPGQEPTPGTAFMPQPAAPQPQAPVYAAAPPQPLPQQQPQAVQGQPLPPVYPTVQSTAPVAPTYATASATVGAPVTAGAPPASAAIRQAAPSNPNSTQNSLLIAEIRDGIVIMNDGTFRSVIMVKSVNFDLMSPQEQEAVEYSYQSFLNSLYFPVQIFIRSQRVDLEPYLTKLDKIRSEHDNMLLAMLMEDYINYIDQLSEQTNIMDKRFYIVVPYSPNEAAEKKSKAGQSKGFITGFIGLFNNKEQHVVINEADLEKAKTELRNRVQAVLQGLLQAGIQGLPLDTQELIELYYQAYNPDTATRQQLKNFNEMSADVITKGQGMAQQAHLQRELN